MYTLTVVRTALIDSSLELYIPNSHPITKTKTRNLSDTIRSWGEGRELSNTLASIHAHSNEETGALMLAEHNSVAVEVQKEIARQAAVPGHDQHPIEPTQNTL